MNSNQRDLIHKKLLQVLSSEAQAIAIYQAEVALFRLLGKPLSPYQEILAEELNHQSVVETFLAQENLQVSSGSRKKMDLISGWLVGTVLALLPARLRDRTHVWAEEEAAKIYRNCADELVSKTFDSLLLSQLVHSLRESAAQESKHATQFKKHQLRN